MIVSAQKGEIELAYYDEAGFSQSHPNRSAWTKLGETHCSEPKRGKRLNVAAAFLSSGKLLAKPIWETINADAFVGFMSFLMENVTKPVTVILDNASIHKAKSIAPLIKILEKQGLTLYFLPPYSPELNRIELLWHKMKYQWLAFKSRDADTLSTDVYEIINNFGSKYTMSFNSKINGKI